ncbi:hypothetical protein DI005_15855 [Prauserella sp. PE36]|uniref:Uncharacterized protein n=1 Tax=Prauserella endophytica TaxID=1592324 RepID=A0ABY2SEF9_9PSEU|nr:MULTISPECIES: hypothetical protein [Prauserella]PXY35301.1 hypothetical protein BAY59_06060 [Prauserella coralliicola]RBM19390.1 hypothetical protein DI005_15855 [Prauserella sp. PE36]TKG73559.1 hypothetical protein FCN18_03115 [Prauserella endophytica]
MLKRAGRYPFSQRLLLIVLALAFAATAVLQAFLASSMSEWWPAVLAAALALAALWCLIAAARAWDGTEKRRL